MKLSASLHAADPLHLAEAAAAVAPHVDSLHIDVMDGCFAPAFGFGEALVRRLLSEKSPAIDVHLMLERPESWALRFASLGARSVAFHAEAVDDAAALAGRIRAEGALAYLALRPETPASRAAAWLPAVDGVLLLTAPAGGGGFIPAALERMAELPVGARTIVDGAIEPAHFPRLRSLEVQLAVVGRTLFGHGAVDGRARALVDLASAPA